MKIIVPVTERGERIHKQVAAEQGFLMLNMIIIAAAESESSAEKRFFRFDHPFVPFVP